MNPKPKLVEEQPAEADFIDDIAELLPAEQRPLWYRDMAHLRRLPADDEMLRIARAMGFLALVTRQTPAQIAIERQQIALILSDSVKAMQSARQDARTASATRRATGTVARNNCRGYQSSSYCRETQRESAPAVRGGAASLKQPRPWP